MIDCLFYNPAQCPSELVNDALATITIVWETWIHENVVVIAAFLEELPRVKDEEPAPAMGEYEYANDQVLIRFAFKRIKQGNPKEVFVKLIATASHECMHAVQEKQGRPTKSMDELARQCSSVEMLKIKYLSEPGEIEAREVSDAFVQQILAVEVPPVEPKELTEKQDYQTLWRKHRQGFAIFRARELKCPC